MDCAELVRLKAHELGFDLCGIARCRFLDEPFRHFESWASEGCDGGLEYMLHHRAMRFNPQLLMEGARSVVVCAASYRPHQGGEVSQRIASYAHSRDYHFVIREKLSLLRAEIERLVPQSHGRIFVDSAPLAEKSWAVEAGLGWIGRQSLVVNPRLGTFMLLGEVVTTAELEPDQPFGASRCGACRACVEACPVEAVRPDRTIDARRCIARQTIERGGTARELHGWIFGCDLCQRACPYNKSTSAAVTPLFREIPELETMTRQEWLRLDENEFERLFGDTPLARCSLAELQRRVRESE